jgi:hypothetical protein
MCALKVHVKKGKTKIFVFFLSNAIIILKIQ